MRNGIWILATPFFQMTLGVDPFLLSLSITVPLFIVLFLGPFVGELSDSIFSQRGNRNSLLITSSVVCGFTYGLLWVVPIDWSEHVILLYIFCISLIFQLFSSVYIIPITSLMFEVSDDSYQRTKALALVAYYNKACSILYHWAFPLAQLSIFGSVLMGIKIVGWGIGIVFILLFGLIPVLLSKESNIPENSRNKTNQTSVTLSHIRDSLKCVFGSKGFGLLMIVVVCQTCVAGYSASMDYYLIVYYMFGGDVVEGSFWKGILSSSYSVMGFIVIPIITMLVRRLGNKITLQYIFLLTMIGGLLKWFIFTPGNEWLLPFDAVFSSAVWLSMFVVVPSMIADLSEINSKKNSLDRKGSFISIHTLAVKISTAIAIMLSGLTLNWIGFDANSAGVQTDGSLMSMRIILSVGTVFSSLTSFWIVKKIRI